MYLIVQYCITVLLYYCAYRTVLYRVDENVRMCFFRKAYTLCSLAMVERRAASTPPNAVAVGLDVRHPGTPVVFYETGEKIYSTSTLLAGAVYTQV